jgi:hypothetical protein
MADNLEVTFAKLVSNTQKEKIPMLMEKQLGFQILDRNDEGTRAVGITAFLVNDVPLYIPAFFLEGKLAGLDLMYVKNNDIFVPARDSWISVFEKQGPSALGKNIDYNDTEMKIVPPKPPSAVRTYSATSFTKSAGEATGLMSKDEFNRMMRPAADQEFDFLSSFLTMSKTAAEVFINTVTTDPEFGNAYFKFYTAGNLRALAETVSKSAIEKQARTEQAISVEVIKPTTPGSVDSLNDGQKRQLIRNGMFIRDDRKQLSKVFTTRMEPTVNQNPSGSGLYDVLLSDGTYKTMLAFQLSDVDCTDRNDVMSPARYPADATLRRKMAVVDAENPREYFEFPVADILVRQPSAEGINKFKSSQGGTKVSIKSLAALRDKKTDGGMGSYWDLLITNGFGPVYQVCGEVKPANDNVIRIGKYDIEVVDDGKLSRIGDRIIVPKGAIYFLRASFKVDKPSLGNLDTLWRDIVKQASLESMDVTFDHGKYQIRVGNQFKCNLDKVAAAEYMAKELGIFGGQVMLMLKEASRARKSEYMLKLAAPYDISVYQGKAPEIMNGPRGKQEPAVRLHVAEVGGRKAPMLPKDVVQTATKASEKGVKEVFETSVIKSLLNIADVSELRKDFLVDMIKGMDKVGRTLFIFYWHRDAFEERYGKEDLKKLEETLKSVFVEIGDLILFLKEKTNASDSADNLFGALSESMASE